VGAVEVDHDAAESYRANHPKVHLKEGDIRGVRATRLRDELGLAHGELSLLKACPPCQGFSSLASGRVDEDVARNDLVLSVVRFVRAFAPEAVLLENVPGMQRDRRFATLLARMETLGYATRSYIVQAEDLASHSVGVGLSWSAFAEECGEAICQRISVRLRLPLRTQSKMSCSR
jgi:DNA (cytosine-5)-methyltransferase 1